MIWLLAKLIRAICWVVAYSPRGLQLFCGDAFGVFVFDVTRFRRRIALANIKIAFPEMSDRDAIQLARRNFRHYGRSLVEFFLIPHLDEKLFSKIFVVKGFENYQKAFERGKGVFILTLHEGSFELTASTCQNLKMPLSVISKKFKSEWLNQLWFGVRGERGITVIPAEKSSYQILKTIARGEVIGFMLDQFMGPPIGVKVRFFGRETGAPLSLALFHERTRAAVIPGYNFRRDDGRLELVFLPEIPFMEQSGGRSENISFMTQVYTDKIEEIVRRHPDQWLWIHRRWKEFRQ